MRDGLYSYCEFLCYLYGFQGEEQVTSRRQLARYVVKLNFGCLGNLLTRD